MTVSNANFIPVQSIFGSGYVPEQYVPDKPAGNCAASAKSDREAMVAATYSRQVGVATPWAVLITVMALSTLLSGMASLFQ